MPNPGMKHRRVVHMSTAGILKPIPEAVDPVGNPPPGLTTNTVAPLHQRGTANRTRSRGAQLTGLSRHGDPRLLEAGKRNGGAMAAVANFSADPAISRGL